MHAREYTEQFCKDNKSLVLTASKCTEQDLYFGNANWEDDFVSLTPDNTVTPVDDNKQMQDRDITSPKSIDQPESGNGGEWWKTGFPTGTTRPSAVITGQLAGSEDFDIEDYMNPRIISARTFIATSPSFAAAVNL